MDYSETESLIKKAKTGDKDSMLVLIESYKPYIFSIIRNYNINSHTLNDLYQISCIAVIKAVMKYKCNSHSFKSYVYTAICNEIRFLARSNKKHNKSVSYHSLINDSENEYESLLHDDFDILSEYIRCEDIKKLKKCILELSPSEQEFIKYIYYENKSLTDYSKEKNISYNKVVRYKNRLLNNLRSKFEK